MFEDQTVELLPARTTMTRTSCGCGGNRSARARGGDAVISQGNYDSGNQTGLVNVGVLNGASVNLNSGSATGGGAFAIAK